MPRPDLRAAARILFVVLLAATAACARSAPAPPAPDRGETAPEPAPSGSARPRPAQPPAAQPPSTAEKPLVGQPFPPHIVPPEPPRALPPPNGVVTPAPIAFVDLAGLKKELETRRRLGRPVFVNFWATWCGPCVQELPDLGNLAREFGEGGPEIIGVSLDYLTVPDRERIEPKVRDMLEKSRVSYPNFVVMSDQDAFLGAFEIIGGLPYSVLYDGAGQPAQRWSGTVVVDEVRAVAARLGRR
jgi:thiol-disulfide isomerase/thioredoxin